MKVLVTGCAGFIGFHLSQVLLARGDTVVGLDNLNDYYDPARKEANLQEVKSLAHKEKWKGEFHFVKGDIRNRELLRDLFSQYAFDGVIHLAAMVGAGATASDLPRYAGHNDLGTAAVLAAMHATGVRRFVQASSMVEPGGSSTGTSRAPACSRCIAKRRTRTRRSCRHTCS